MSNMGSANQIEMQSASTLYTPNGMPWTKQVTDYCTHSADINGHVLNQANRMQNIGSVVHQSYEQVMGFGSDEDDCYDNMSDQNGDDSMSSVDDTRIQQL
jgi:hypothetical protein